MDQNYVDGLSHGKWLEYFESGELTTMKYYLTDEEVTKKEWNLVLNEKHEYMQWAIYLEHENHI